MLQQFLWSLFNWPVKGTSPKTISIDPDLTNPIISLRPSFQQFADEHLPETALDRNLAAVKRPPIVNKYNLARNKRVDGIPVT